MTHVVDGDLVEVEDLQVLRAREVRDAALWHPLVKLIEARVRKIDGSREEVLVVDVHPELPQDLVYDIRTVERLSVSFRESERKSPRITALRKDFPTVPHLNWTAAGDAKSLCVYEDPWSEVRLRWTGAAFLKHLVQWLSRTAISELHGADQPLEPFLFESANEVVFPSQVFEEEASLKVFTAEAVKERPGWPYTLKLREVDVEERTGARRFYCVALSATPTVQQAMRDCPQNLKELSSILKDVGVDLWGKLCALIRVWYSGAHRPRHDDGVVVLVRLPRLREGGGDIDSEQHLAFELYPIQELAMASGQVGSAGVEGELLPLATGDVDEALASFISVVPMRAIQSMDRAVARLVSGLEAVKEEPRVVLIGAGALGSQIHENLSRMGWGRWTVVDKDKMLPHNVARHRLGEIAVGVSKARSIESVSCIETPHNVVEAAFLADALSSDVDKKLSSAYREADLILDVSTSIAVSRFLAKDLESSARRSSLFVNPSGRDVVMLMEDAERLFTLDVLEAQYYQTVLSDERLVEHIQKVPGIRYGGSCRDVATKLSQDDLALASGILSRQIRMADPGPAVVIWQTMADGCVTRIETPVANIRRLTHEGWEFVVNAGVVAKAAKFRKERLPNETGGVLIGYFDVPRKTVYVVDVLPAPRDSTEHNGAFIRGFAGLDKVLKVIEVRSAGQVGYLGEWHSHPDGAGVEPSPDDKVLQSTIAEEMRMDGWPGVMMIVGEGDDVGFYAMDW